MEQYDRYLALQNRIPEMYARLTPYIRAEDVTSFWAEGIQRVQNVISRITFTFMQSGLRGRLGTPPKVAAGLANWLDKHLAEDAATEALVADEVAGMPTMLFRGRAVTVDAIRFLYYATVLSISADISLKTIRSVLEWGGGYGAQAKIFKRLGRKDLTYTIADLPPLCLLQWVYLSCLFGEKA